MLATLVACAPLIVATTAASVAYTSFPSGDIHNVFWPPRFAFTWGILSAGVLFSYATLQRKEVSGWIWVKLLPLALAVVVAQERALVRIRSYSAVDRVASVINGSTNSARYTAEEKLFLRCLERQMPPRISVYLTPLLWSTFHNHDIDAYREDNPHRRRPEVMICDRLGRDFLDANYTPNCIQRQGMLYSEEESRFEQVAGIAVRYLEPHSAAVVSCIQPRERP
jgi:hypothetical protein